MFSEPVGRWPRKPSNDLPLITAAALVSDPFRIRAIKSIVLKCISGARGEGAGGGATLFVGTADIQLQLYQSLGVASASSVEIARSRLTIVRGIMRYVM